ncbi:hypothetical protein [Streptomyces cyaneofuscatus]|uniref:hypothetical protein n=1 Tax=Streptomyces cyaneofuscatus TaxID=66883 RepID=UPI0033A5F95E
MSTRNPPPPGTPCAAGDRSSSGRSLLFLVALSTWIGAKDTSLGQVWSAIWNDDGPAPPM